jgi:nicotinate (nicotinamide) nucleotide adenylyltransferase
VSLNLYLGGTFDPVHFGHVNLADAAYQELKTNIIWLPCSRPIHKSKPCVDIRHRLKMLDLVVRDRDEWSIDLSDVVENKAQSTYDLFAKKNSENNCLLIGSDGLLSLTSWHDWEKLSDLINLVVLHRYSNQLIIPQEVLRVFKIAKNKSCLLKNHAGYILMLRHQLKCIDSTRIRELFMCQKLCQIENYMPRKVVNYILDNGLYVG